jgi:hypothetical protein
MAGAIRARMRVMSVLNPAGVNLIVLAIVLVLRSAVVHVPVASADGSWLDGPPPAWNAPGQPVPGPTEAVSRANEDPRCLRSARPADNPDDAQVEQAGWILVDAYTAGWETRVVRAASSFDGMCRPNNFQAFVFYQGVFAGTLSPQQMMARSDGALGEVRLFGPGAMGGLIQLQASFQRYTREDPLCCPSARTNVSYSLELENGQPVVKATRAATIPTRPPA